MTEHHRKTEHQFTPQEAAQRRDATIKAMIATPPKKHKDEPKRDGTTRGRPKKGGA